LIRWIKGTKEDFDFSGFTFFHTHARGGEYRLSVRTRKKKLKTKEQEAKAWLRTWLTKPAALSMQQIQRALAGHFNYYGVSGNFCMIQNFWRYKVLVLSNAEQETPKVEHEAQRVYQNLESLSNVGCPCSPQPKILVFYCRFAAISY
jgi:hypothetical protein